MGEIRVDLESIQAGRAGVLQTHARLADTLETLERDLAPMIESWSGAAQDAYLARKREWDEAAAALAQVLRDIVRAVGNAHENYQSAHSATVQIWS